MVLVISLLNTQYYKEGIKGKVEQSMGKCSALPQHLGVEAIEMGVFVSPLTTIANFSNNSFEMFSFF